MSETVWKFVLGLADLQAIDLPEDAEILHVADQFGEIAMWVRLDPNAASTMRRFTVIGTGHIVPPNSTYRGTALTGGGSFVGHVFEVRA